MKSVVFIKQHLNYFPGDNAGFEEATAKELIKRGVAVEESVGAVEAVVNFPEPLQEESEPDVNFPEPLQEEMPAVKSKGK